MKITIGKLKKLIVEAMDTQNKSEHEQALDLINDHRRALGYEPYDSLPDPIAELERIESLAQYGVDPFENKKENDSLYRAGFEVKPMKSSELRKIANEYYSQNSYQINSVYSKPEIRAAIPILNKAKSLYKRALKAEQKEGVSPDEDSSLTLSDIERKLKSLKQKYRML